ncbi:RloB domain-containing protein [Fusobacterium necrogenes]
MNVTWSNEAIELWFLLHFEFISTGISREQYIGKLNFYFKKIV